MFKEGFYACENSTLIPWADSFQTASSEAVWSGSALFVYAFLASNYTVFGILKLLLSSVVVLYHVWVATRLKIKREALFLIFVLLSFDKDNIWMF